MSLSPLSLDYSKNGSPWVQIDLTTKSNSLDYSKSGSPWIGWISPTQSLVISSMGISSAEVFGSNGLNSNTNIVTEGVISQEVFGNPIFPQTSYINHTSITSTELFGSSRFINDINILA